ncbi:hypothetical protein ACFLZ5_05250 [Thermodesulfobacteriota bacterium]
MAKTKEEHDKPRVLWLMQYAPHYREELLQNLGESFELTVTAVSPSEYSLIPPENRKGYTYIEKQGLRIGEFWFLNEVPELFGPRVWDAVICTEDMHHPLRYVWYLFWHLTGHRFARRWIWWGHFTGRREWRILRIFRRFLVNSSSGALTYTEPMKETLIETGGDPQKIISSNNSEISREDFDITPIHEITDSLNLIYVGRNLPHKKVMRLVELAKKIPFLRIRLIGPGMEEIRTEVKKNRLNSRVSIYGSLVGKALSPHLKWTHLVVSPGHVGLLVVTAARYGRPIVVDSSSIHAPEEYIAQTADQPFIDWSCNDIVTDFLTNAFQGHYPLQSLGDRLVQVVREQYTIETMAQRFSEIILRDDGKKF